MVSHTTKLFNALIGGLILFSIFSCNPGKKDRKFEFERKWLSSSDGVEFRVMLPPSQYHWFIRFDQFQYKLNSDTSKTHKDYDPNIEIELVNNGISTIKFVSIGGG